MKSEKVSKMGEGIWLMKNEDGPLKGQKGIFFLSNEKGERQTDYYEWIGGKFQNGWVPFLDYHHCGFINTKFREMGRGRFGLAKEFQDGLALVGIWNEELDNFLYYYINPYGDIVLGPYCSAESFTSGLAKVTLSIIGGHATIDTKGRITELSFEDAGHKTIQKKQAS